MSQCIATLKACQGADELHDYAFDITDEFSRIWRPNSDEPLGSIVRPGTTGLEYISAGGVTNGELEPDWPLENGGTVDDGSVLWTGQSVSYSGLIHRIGSVAWTAPAGITLSDPQEIDRPAQQEARISVTGGVAGRKYRIVGLITTLAGDEIFEVRLEMTIK